MRELTHSRFWQFEQIDRIEELFFNKSLERFYEYGIAGIARENIQNSLDAILNEEAPVVVKIKTGELQKNEIPGIEEIEQRIENLAAGNEYTNETVAHMQSALKRDRIKYISFEDENTKGLTGAIKGEEGSSDDTWAVYAYKKGLHAVDANKDHEHRRGGSHGIGKIASNAGSDIHMMFFANCDRQGNKHIGGTVQLIEHTLENKSYRSTGYFSDVISQKYYPFENDFDQEVFDKSTRGLKIIIPFLREGYDNEKKIIKSICDSFFLAILERHLIVHINDHVLDEKTIKHYILDEDYFEQEVEKIKKNFTPLYYKTYKEEKAVQIKVKNQVDEYVFNLYFKYDEQIPTGRVAIIRTIGMKIEDFKVKNNIRKPFNAVLIGGQKEDRYLKSLENESHTKIDFDHIKDKRLKSHARRFINKLTDAIASIINEKIKELNPSDGVLDTSATIYMVENQFERELSKGAQQSNLGGNRTLYQTGRGTKKERRDPGEGGKTIDPPKNKRKRKPKKVKPGSKFADNNDGMDRKIYEIRPESVKRIIVQESESLYIDLSDNDDFKQSKECKLKMIVIDGMGKECDPSEFKLDEMYCAAMCRINRSKLSLKENEITGIPINDGKIFINLTWNQDTNKSLKLVYYIEV